MKIKLLFTTLVFLISLTASYASFPVLRTKKAVNTELSNKVSDDSKSIVSNFTNTVKETYTAVAATAAGKDLWVGIALWFFLGAFAAHRWYYNKPIGWNILFILTAGGLGVWWVIDLINMINGNF